MSETIAAIATPQAAGGIGIVRISGENACEIADRVFTAADKTTLTDSNGYAAHFGHVYDDTEKIDDAIALAQAMVDIGEHVGRTTIALVTDMDRPLGHKVGNSLEVIEAVERVNERQKSIVYDKIIKAVGSVKGKTVAIIGLSFKPETDDMREAPALVVIDKLLKDGATVRVFDPIAMDECKRRIGDSVFYAKNMYDAADGADVFALMTEWHQFRLPSWNVIKKIMKGYVVVDGRNIYDRNELEELGFVYTRIGEK